MVRLLALIAVLAGLAVAPAAGEEGEPGWQKGFVLWASPAEYGSPGTLRSLHRLHQTGATVVVPVVTWYVSDPSADDIHPGEDTPSDNELATVIDAAHWAGLSVVLELHVNCEDGSWRGFISPTNAEPWFANYRYLVRHYASFAAEHEVEGLIIGAELVQMTRPQHTKVWRSLIAEARERFPGFLTYGANWGSNAPEGQKDDLEEFTHVGFWPELDYIGIAAYFELGDARALSHKELFQAWNGWRRREIGPLQAKYKMPVVFTEVGYRSTGSAGSRPWDYESQDVSLETQTSLYEALFDYWRHVPWFEGVYLWYWSTDAEAGGPYDSDYVPQGKPSLDVIKDWFRRLPSAPLERGD